MDGVHKHLSSTPEPSNQQLLFEDIGSQNELGSNNACAADAVLSKIGCGVFQFIAFSLAVVTVIAIDSQSRSYSYINLQVNQQWNLSSLAYAALPAATGVTNLLGAVVYSCLIDAYGRVWPYAMCMLLLGAFLLASSFSPSFLVLVILRSIGALSVAGFIIYPMLVEFLPVNKRGKAGVLLMIATAVGGCITTGLAWWLIPTYPTNGWRYLVIVTALLAFTASAFRLLFYVESPRFLIVKSKTDTAWRTFSLMARVNCMRLNDLVEKENFMEHVKIEEKPSRKTCAQQLKNFLMVFRRGRAFHTLSLLVVHVTVFSAYMGMTLFLPALLSVLHVDPFFAVFIGFASQVPGALLMSIIMEWPAFGRLNSLRLFMILSIIFFFLFAFIQNSVTIPLFTVFLYFSLAPTLSLLHTYTAECYPTEIRAMALSFFDIFVDICAIWVPLASGYLTDKAEQHSWISPVVWGSTLTLGLVVSLVLRRETRGENLQEFFTDKSETD